MRCAANILDESSIRSSVPRETRCSRRAAVKSRGLWKTLAARDVTPRASRGIGRRRGRAATRAAFVDRQVGERAVPQLLHGSKSTRAIHPAVVLDAAG